MNIRSMVFVAVITAGLALPTVASAGTTAEVGYVEGSLAVADLAAGRLTRAEQILAAENAEDARDPARLINLGIVYSRSGRVAEARHAFISAERVAEAPLVLSDGREVSSRVVAREQLAMLDRNSVAMR
ncbi:MAG: tetratricopeptide repeat protein [Sphingobium sp.]